MKLKIDTNNFNFDFLNQFLILLIKVRNGNLRFVRLNRWSCLYSMRKGGENSNDGERLLDISRCIAWNVLSRNGWAGIAGYIRNGQIERFGSRLFDSSSYD